MPKLTNSSFSWLNFFWKILFTLLNCVQDEKDLEVSEGAAAPDDLGDGWVQFAA